MTTENIKHHYTTTQTIVAYVAGLLFIIPLAPFICRFIPPVFIADFNIDLIISVLISILIVRLMIWLVKPMILPALIMACGILIYNQYHNEYTIGNMTNGYKALITQNWDGREIKQTDQLSFNPDFLVKPELRTSRLLQQKVQYNDSLVRNFSVQHSLEYFDTYHYKYRELARYLSLFKYINDNFKYVSDNQRDEYYATPRETILNGLGGDCDDHSILMASCLMSIGATCRLVIIEGHMYPEMYAGNEADFNRLQQAVIQLFNNQQIDRIYYHENEGEYWINLDYTAHYPGGPYMNDNIKLLVNL